jgi:tripartite-type tricarboxylate transporter receptor subunit TctC
METRSIFLTVSAFASAMAIASHSSAQPYPSRPITMVLGFAAGGPADTTARILAERMRVSLGQPVIIENVAGASGSIAGSRVARAAGDGYTVIFGNWATHVLNGAVYPLQYDLLSDFEPVSLLVSESMLITSRKGMAAKDLRELIAWIKANPGKASAGTGGGGSVAHVVGVLFEKETSTRFTFVPYRGLGPAMQDLVSGQIDIIFDTSANSLQHVRAGSIKAYAVTTKSRLAEASEIPTVDEAGLPGFYASNWRAIWAPRATPKHIITKLNDAAMDALADPVVRQRLAHLGQEIFPREQQTPEALGALHKAEVKKWWPLIKAAGIKAE